MLRLLRCEVKESLTRSLNILKKRLPLETFNSVTWVRRHHCTRLLLASWVVTQSASASELNWMTAPCLSSECTKQNGKYIQLTHSLVTAFCEPWWQIIKGQLWKDLFYSNQAVINRSELKTKKSSWFSHEWLSIQLAATESEVRLRGSCTSRCSLIPSHLGLPATTRTTITGTTEWWVFCHLILVTLEVARRNNIEAVVAFLTISLSLTLQSNELYAADQQYGPLGLLVTLNHHQAKPHAFCLACSGLNGHWILLFTSANKYDCYRNALQHHGFHTRLV